MIYHKYKHLKGCDNNTGYQAPVVLELFWSNQPQYKLNEARYREEYSERYFCRIIYTNTIYPIDECCTY